MRSSGTDIVLLGRGWHQNKALQLNKAGEYASRIIAQTLTQAQIARRDAVSTASATPA